MDSWLESIYKNECDPHFLPLQFLFPLFNLKYLSFEPELITEWNVLICIIFSFFSTECEVTMLLQLSTQSKKLSITNIKSTLFIKK